MNEYESLDPRFFDLDDDTVGASNVDTYLISFFVSEAWLSGKESRELIEELSHIVKERHIGGFNETVVHASKTSVIFYSDIYGDFTIDRRRFIAILRAWESYARSIGRE